MKELKERIFTKTPKFFKRLQTIAITLAAIAAALTGAVQSGGLELPEFIQEFLKWCIVAGSVAAAVAQTPKDDADTQEN